MANKPLQTIKFPGLTDTYTVPQVDSNFVGTAGQVPDSKKVHDEIDSLKEDLNAISNGDYVYTEFTTGKYINTSVNPVNINSPTTNAGYRYCVLDVSEGDKFKINIYDGGAARAYCFIDASSNVLLVSAGSSKVLNMVITAPANATKLVLNDTTASGHYAYKISHLIERIDNAEAEIEVLQENPIFRKAESYNLVDFVDMYYNHKYNPAVGGSYTDNTENHTIKGLIPVTAGNYVISGQHVGDVYFFGQDGTYVSKWSSLNSSKAWEAVEIPSNIYYCKPQWSSATSIGTATGLADGDIPSFYYVEQYGARSDQKPARPKTLIDGRYITDSVFGVISPSERSYFDLMTRCREIKRNNRERGAVRIGTFNIYGAMIKYVNWPVVKDICTEYGIDACGFQEVTNSAEKWTGDVNKYSFSQSMMGGSFAYSNLANDPDGAAVRILSGLTMTDGEFTTLSYTYGNVEKSAPLSHALISIPNYHHARDWDKVISMYTVHLPTTGDEARIILNLIADVIAADTHDYKMLVADTNCFSVDASTNKPWCWSYFENMGLYPAATDFTKSTYCYPLTTEQWSTNQLDFIDNVFITDNMKCIDWGIADAKDYPIAGASGGYVSDHCMLYADIIFDFVDGFNDV